MAPDGTLEITPPSTIDRTTGAIVWLSLTPPTVSDRVSLIWQPGPHTVAYPDPEQWSPDWITAGPTSATIEAIPMPRPATSQNVIVWAISAQQDMPGWSLAIQTAVEGPWSLSFPPTYDAARGVSQPWVIMGE
jgi:hypothetical protein